MMHAPIRPLWRYYGSKWSLAKKYPRPDPGIEIVEPFAGSACFALHYWWHPVTLYDVDDNVVATWRYLLRATPEEILSLPDLQPGEDVRDVVRCPDAQRLIGWWLGAGQRKRNTISGWAQRHLEREGAKCVRAWSAALRRRIADALPKVRHWRIEQRPWHDVPQRRAFWFVDPPYQGRAGSYYSYGSSGIDYAALGAWCRTLPGRVVVCEHDDADWLPFETLTTKLSGGAATGSHGKRKSKREVVWTNHEPAQGVLL